MDAPQRRQLRPPRHRDGAGPARPRAVDAGSCATTRATRTGPTATASSSRAATRRILLYSMLYLTGYGLTLDDLQAVPPAGAAVPRATPRSDLPPGVEVTTGPLGQGFANGVGMGIAERMLRARFGPEVVDHHTFVHLQRRRPDGGHQPRGGIAGRAPRARAAHLRLRRQPHHHRRPDRARPATTTSASASRPTAGTSSTSARSPTTPTPWRRRCAGPWPVEDRPSLLILRSHIGWPSPHKTDTAKAHGDPLGDDEVRATKEILGLPPDETFWVPDEVLAYLPPGGPARPGRCAGEWEKPARRPGPATAHDWDALLGGRGMPGWADEAPDLAGRATRRDPPGHQRLPERRRRRRSPASSPGGADLTGNTGTKLDGMLEPELRAPRRPPDRLRRPRARHGRAS